MEGGGSVVCTVPKQNFFNILYCLNLQYMYIYRSFNSAHVCARLEKEAKVAYYCKYVSRILS